MKTVTTIVTIQNTIMPQPTMVDVATSVARLFEFKKAWAKINIDSVGYRWLSLDTLRSSLQSHSGSLQAWLDANPQAELSLTTAAPFSTTVRYATARDAFSAGFTVTPVHPLYGANASDSTKTAIRLERANSVSYQTLDEYTLVSVNGFLHQTSTDNRTQIVVLEGNTSAQKAKMNNVGLISFFGLGKIQRLPTKTMQITASVTGSGLYNGAAIESPVSLVNKTVFLSFGGYLFSPDQTVFSITGDKRLVVDFKKIDLHALYFESKHYLDLSSLACVQGNPDGVVSTQELHSDANIRSWFDISQSFLIVVDNANVFVNRHYVRNSGSCTSFIAHEAVSLPLQIGLGRVPEYLVRYEDRQWHLDIYSRQLDRLLYRTSLIQDTNLVNTNIIPDNPVRQLGACLLQIGVGYVA